MYLKMHVINILKVKLFFTVPGWHWSCGRCFLPSAKAPTSFTPSRWWRRKLWFRMTTSTVCWWKSACWLWAISRRFLLHCIPVFRRWSVGTVYKKTPVPLLSLNNSAKNEPISISFGLQNPEKISRQKIVNSLTSPELCCRTTLWKTTHLTLLAG